MASFQFTFISEFFILKGELMPAKLSNRDFQYLVEAAKAFEKQIKGVTAYPDSIEENTLVVIHKDLLRKYELKSYNDNYQRWIDSFRSELLEKEYVSSLERE